MTEPTRRCPSAVPPIAPFERIPGPGALIAPDDAPDTIAGWQALADGLLTDQGCAFHRNVEISSRYAWLYKVLPTCLKWAGMAAIASHHVRLALFPLRLDADRTGYVDIPHSLGPPADSCWQDVHTIRATNNAIFNDIFWVHLAYVTADDGIERLRILLQRTARLRAGPRRLRGDRPRAPSPGRRGGVGGGATSGRRPHLARQRPAPRARAACPGAAPLRPPLVRVRPPRLARRCDELRGARSATGAGVLHLVLPVFAHPWHAMRPSRTRGRGSPGTTTVGAGSSTSVVPQFRRFDADMRLVDASLRRIFDDARRLRVDPLHAAPGADTTPAHDDDSRLAGDRRVALSRPM